MTTFAILTGKALKSAIAGRAKAAATFTEREHQIAYSCLHHLEVNSCPSHLNALLDATPVNYRRGLIAWASAYGKAKMNPETRQFEFSKTKKSDLPAALIVAPANYQKMVKAADETKAKEFDEIAYLERMIKAFGEKGGSARVAKALDGALTLAKSTAIADMRSQANAPAKAA